MCPISKRVNAIRCRHRQAPKPEPTLRALVGAKLLRDRVYVDTATQAAVVMGVPRPQLDAAAVVLQVGDENLILDIMAGRESLTHAAARLRRRVKLIESFKAATPDDKAAFGRAVGTAELFDSTIVPAL
jgi:hypothetical protein